MRRRESSRCVCRFWVIVLTVVMLSSCAGDRENTESGEPSDPSSLYLQENVSQAEATIPLLAEFKEDEWARAELCLPNVELPETEGDDRYVNVIWAVQELYAVCGVYEVKPQEADDAYMTLYGLYCYSTVDGSVANKIVIDDQWEINQLFFDQTDVFILLVGKQGTGSVPYQWCKQAIGAETLVLLKEGAAAWNRPPQMARFNHSLLLFDYDQGGQKVVGYRPDQEIAVALFMGQRMPVDLEVSANAEHLALLVADGENAKFEVYDTKANLVVSRELRDDEKVYSWHMLSDGLLIYMQDLANGRFDEYKMIWMSLTGKEREYKEKAQLWNGLDNGTDQAVFVELDSKVDGSMIIHIYKAEESGLAESRYRMPYSLSQLPAYTHLQENQVYFFAENQEKLFRLEKVLS